MKLKRMTAALLLLAMLLSCLPLSVLAADAEPVDGTENRGHCACGRRRGGRRRSESPVCRAVRRRRELLFLRRGGRKAADCPVKISYQGGQTIWQALNASQYRFEMDGGDGFVTTIENVTGNYRYSSVPSGVTLDHAAASVTYFRFTESEQRKTAGLQMLMQVMAGYLDKPADVRSAASAAYQKAYDNYLCIDSDTAKSYAEKNSQRRSRTMKRDSRRHTRSRFHSLPAPIIPFRRQIHLKAVLCGDRRKTAPAERQLYVLHSQE